jgi:5-methylcytosine-specific restriction endonuclease McrA
VPTLPAMSRRRKQTWDEKLLELGMGGGMMIGLLSAAQTASRAPAEVCRPRRAGASDCASQALTDALTPYFKGAAIGAGVGLLVATLLIVTWRYMRSATSGPFARHPEPAPAHRKGIPERVRHEVWRRDRGTCVDCGSRARLEFDHIIPLSRGGSDTARNLEIRCEVCNRAKGSGI